MTHRQALQGFPDKSQGFFFCAVPTWSREVTVAFSFISERIVLCGVISALSIGILS
jgi:hypothetical protein